MFTITPAAPADMPEAAEVLAEAFEHETVISSLIGRGGNRLRRTAALFRGLMFSGSLRTGHIDLARRNKDGEVLGAAIWERPGSDTTLLDQATQLPAFLRALGWCGIFRASQVQATLATHRPVEPHWYLAQIGVSAKVRGLGVGSALLENRLALIDKTNAPSYLESSNTLNRELYKRHGFVTIGQISGLRPALPAAMWRPAT